MCVGRVVESAVCVGEGGECGVCVGMVMESAGLCVWKGGDECRVC